MNKNIVAFPNPPPHQKINKEIKKEKSVLKSVLKRLKHKFWIVPAKLFLKPDATNWQFLKTICLTCVQMSSGFSAYRWPL